MEFEREREWIVPVINNSRSLIFWLHRKETNKKKKMEEWSCSLIFKTLNIISIQYVNQLQFTALSYHIRASLFLWICPSFATWSVSFKEESTKIIFYDNIFIIDQFLFHIIQLPVILKIILWQSLTNYNYALKNEIKKKICYLSSTQMNPLIFIIKLSIFNKFLIYGPFGLR